MERNRKKSVLVLEGFPVSGSFKIFNSEKDEKAKYYSWKIPLNTKQIIKEKYDYNN